MNSETWGVTAASGVLSFAALLVSFRALRYQRRAAEAAGLSAAEAAEEAEASRYEVPWELFRGAGDSYMLRNAGDERVDAVSLEGVDLDVILLDDAPVEVAPRAALKFIASPSHDDAHPRIRVTWRRPGHDRPFDWTEPLP